MPDNWLHRSYDPEAFHTWQSDERKIKERRDRDLANMFGYGTPATATPAKTFTTAEEVLGELETQLTKLLPEHDVLVDWDSMENILADGEHQSFSILVVEMTEPGFFRGEITEWTTGAGHTKQPIPKMSGNDLIRFAVRQIKELHKSPPTQPQPQSQQSANPNTPTPAATALIKEIVNFLQHQIQMPAPFKVFSYISNTKTQNNVTYFYADDGNFHLNFTLGQPDPQKDEFSGVVELASKAWSNLQPVAKAISQQPTSTFLDELRVEVIRMLRTASKTLQNQGLSANGTALVQDLMHYMSQYHPKPTTKPFQLHGPVVQNNSVNFFANNGDNTFAFDINQIGQTYEGTITISDNRQVIQSIHIPAQDALRFYQAALAAIGQLSQHLP